MPSKSLMLAPMCLIENRNGELIINEEAVKILSEITQPVVVVAIVGKYRTGKSYLMNKLARSNRGFALGSTIQSKTKGIWMWCVLHPSKPGHTLVLLDTEGLGDVEKGDSKNDVWIFSLAVLLSSNLVFNSLGTIDQQAMEQLQYVTELTKRIRLKSTPGKEEDESAEFKRVFPSFTWCVRDFTLILEQDGKEITEDEYLMNSLKIKKGTSKSIQDYNLPRKCIIQYFHTHKCFVFDRPASKKKLQRLEELQESELEEEFVEQVRKFCDYMFKEGRVKTLPGGLLVTGTLLANLAATYVKAIQSGSVPCMENAVLALSMIENAGAVQDALAKYESDMKLKEDKFPTETQEEFLHMHKECEKEAIQVFLKRSFKDENQKYQYELKDKLDLKMKDFSNRNEEASAQRCRILIQELSVAMEKTILEGAYSKPGGHKLYLEEKLRILEAYNTKKGKGIKGLEVLQDFLNGKTSIEAAILHADETLTEKEKQIAEERDQAERAEREKQMLEENNRRLEERIEDQKRSFEQHEAMLLKKVEEDKQNMIKENEWLITQKLKEQKDLLDAGMKEMVGSLQNQIESLKSQNNELSRRRRCVVS
ncbi:guanylate-binding protein 1-like [Rhinophrynus dorsalis]